MNQPHLLSIEDFFRSPEQTNFQLSPDNQTLSFMQPWEAGNRRLNIFCRPSRSNDQANQITHIDSRDIYHYAWIDNQTMVYIADQGGDENINLFRINLKDSSIVNLTPYPEVKAGIVSELEDDPDHILISLNKRDKRLFDVYRCHIQTGKLSLIAENPGNISQWMCDHDGKLRIATTTDGVNTSLLYRTSETAPWQTLATSNFKETLSPLCFTADNQKLYVASNRGRDKSAVFLFNYQTAEEEELIYEHPEVDVSSLYLSKKTKQPLAISYTTDRCHFVCLDSHFESIFKTIQAKLAPLEFRINFSKDETQAIVRSFSDQSLGDIFHFDCQSLEFTHLSTCAPWLPSGACSPMQSIEYQARDGLTIHGYLTCPQGKSKNLPVIINPHGGPWARDAWGFNPEVQCLAYHGYAVLQMNFRGSTGYGRDFWQKGFKAWGKAMQDDITDGVHWLINQGIADPKRIGIYGASYGGYACLAGLAFTPELYACGIDYVGVSSIFTLIDSFPPYWELYRAMFYEMVGHPEADQQQLHDTSPLYHVDQIKAPLFIAQGANDPRVKKSESDQMVDALKQKGLPVTYLVKDNEGHGFHNEENKFEFYRAALKFLEQHMPAHKNNHTDASVTVVQND